MTDAARVARFVQEARAASALNDLRELLRELDAHPSAPAMSAPPANTALQPGGVVSQTVRTLRDTTGALIEVTLDASGKILSSRPVK
ncbi:MAG TPA: hypothetical protein VEO54_12585 [Thermoanaerobaculia bacterium]|nr:hypothetical protein [Thermoanaerobaculia bacterium]